MPIGKNKMKVYWVENEKGEYYSSVRYFTRNGPPKLYGSEEVLRRSLGTSLKYSSPENPVGSLRDDMIICSGTLIKDEK